MEDYPTVELRRMYGRHLKDLREIQKEVGKYLAKKSVEFKTYPQDVCSISLERTANKIFSLREEYQRTLRGFGRVRDEMIRRRIKHKGDKWGYAIGDDELDD